MALTKCKECGSEVSKKAEKCPNCGAPIKKKTSIFTWIVAIVLVLWVAGYFSSGESPSTSTSSASESQEAKVHKMGETVGIGYTSYSVWKAWYSERLSSNQYTNQQPDASFLFVELTVRNDDKKARTIPPFKLVDGSGSEYETTSKAWAVDNNIGALDSLNPGVSKQGVIVFDVPKGKDYSLKVSGGYWSSDEALININPSAN